MELNKATFKSKEENNIPSESKIIKKDVQLEVEEIENGFLILKSIDMKYKDGDSTEYLYKTKKYFSKENPLKINLEEIEEKSLADSFE